MRDEPFSATVHEADEWVTEVAKELDTEDKHRAYHALRASLQAPRDRPADQEAAQLAAQLPLVLRGVSYEGHRPSDTPAKERTLEEFLALVADKFPSSPTSQESEEAFVATAAMLNRHVSEGEIEDVKLGCRFRCARPGRRLDDPLRNPVRLRSPAMDIAAHVQAALRGLGAEFEVLSIDPDLADTAAFCAAYGFDLSESANAILIASKRPPGRYAVCVALATTRLDVNHRVRELLGVKKLSFAPPDLTTELTGMMIGGVTPFGLPDDIPIYVDQEVMRPPRVVLGGGDRASKIVVAPQVLERVPNLEVVEGLANPIE